MVTHAILTTIDVAHPPIPPGLVEEELLQALTRVRGNPVHRVLKVVHGYGSSGKGGSTKETVRNWAFRNRSKLRAVVEGEEYTLYNPIVQQLRKEVGNYADPDLSVTNPGITILWIK